MTMTDTEARIQSLAYHLGVDPDEISNEYGNILSVDGGEYLVLTDAEADAAQDEYLEHYIEECILPELPDAYQNYFDHDAWKRDARFDGRGHCLASYDGNEEESGEFFIYRVN